MKTIKSLLGTLALAITIAPSFAAVNVDIFATHTTDSGGGAPYADYVGSFTSPMVDFATTTGYNWHPFGLQEFGALVTGYLCVPESGLYTFALGSDDGSLLYLNNNIVVDRGGPTGPGTTYGAPIALPGNTPIPLKIEYYEDFGGPAGLDLYMIDASGNTTLVPESYLKTVPEPGTIAAIATGALGLFGFRRRK